MTDIDELIAGLRTDVPDMTDSAFQAGRARLQAVVDAPLVDVPGPDPVVTPLTPRRRVLRSPPRLQMIASAAAVVALAAGALLIPFGDSPQTAIPVAESAIQAGTSDDPVGPGQYRYVEVRRWVGMHNDQKADNGFPLLYLYENVTRTWLPADGTTDWLTRGEPSGKYRWLNGSDEEYWNAVHEKPAPMRIVPDEDEFITPCDGIPWAAGGIPCTAPGSWPPPAFFATLPRDPAQLYDWLQTNVAQNWAGGPSYSMLEYVAGLLETGLVPPDLRAAMYQALAKVPDIKITEQFNAPDGLRGTAYSVSVTGDGEQYDVVINPETGQYIGQRKILEEPRDGIPAGTVTYQALVYTAIADGPGQTPTR